MTFLYGLLDSIGIYVDPVLVQRSRAYRVGYRWGRALGGVNLFGR
jgi:hypothetical protein